ncbi:putative membrane protein [Phocaeicola coprocola DSM 17136]|jgi:drug/metabolite transporter (DMT)-like permease|uniref:Putative membrane protein n=2 Tax=Phocaeicola coprocola TaxID=310298 RepID=B3JEQ2_9BACT|nr:putative membrane protein [Phocaeicola coprocola DSM 17136]
MNRKPPIRIQKRLKVLRHDSSGTRILFSHQQSKNIYKILRIYSANMKNISKNAIIGYPAGIITGITYGLNPLFGVPLMKEGAAIESILFFRYAIAVLFLGGFLLLSRQSFKISWKQAGVLLILGLLYTSSSVFLFEAYSYIASGLATTIIFLYPVLVAIIMVFLRVVPSWPVWLSIILTFVGVVIMTQSDSTQTINPIGVILSLGSALVYALFIVIINRSKIISNISNSLLTFYALTVGAIIFLGKITLSDIHITTGLTGNMVWLNLVGLAILPTVVSTATLAIATRNIGATKASVLGVFEPVTAILIGTVVFGEALTTNIIVGILLSIAAITFMIAKTKR